MQAVRPEILVALAVFVVVSAVFLRGWLRVQRWVKAYEARLDRCARGDHFPPEQAIRERWFSASCTVCGVPLVVREPEPTVRSMALLSSEPDGSMTVRSMRPIIRRPPGGPMGGRAA